VNPQTHIMAKDLIENGQIDQAWQTLIKEN
jgi:hypothetical protein